MGKTRYVLLRNSALVLVCIWLGIVIYWNLRSLSGLLTLHDYVFQPWLAIRYWTLYFWAPWVPLAPVVLYLANRVRIMPHDWLRPVLAQLGLMFVLSLVHGFLVAMLYYHVGWMDADMAAYAPWQHMGHFLFGENVILFDALIYASITAGRNIRDFHLRLKQNEPDAARMEDQDRSGGQRTEEFPLSEAPPERIMIRSAGRVFFIRPDEIHWVEAEGDYVSLHTAARSHLVHETMKQMERVLAPLGFQRIHRSSLVKVDMIRELVPNDSGDYAVVLHDGTVLKLSRRYRDGLYKKMQCRAESFA